MIVLPWLQRYAKEIVLVTTTVIAASVTSRDVIDQKAADSLLGDETPLEAATRKIVGAGLVTCGTSLKAVPFVHTDFREQVGGQLMMIGNLLGQYSLKKFESR